MSNDTRITVDVAKASSRLRSPIDQGTSRGVNAPSLELRVQVWRPRLPEPHEHTSAFAGPRLTGVGPRGGARIVPGYRCGRYWAAPKASIG